MSAELLQEALVWAVVIACLAYAVWWTGKGA